MQVAFSRGPRTVCPGLKGRPGPYRSVGRGYHQCEPGFFLLPVPRSPVLRPALWWLFHVEADFPPGVPAFSAGPPVAGATGERVFFFAGLFRAATRLSFEPLLLPSSSAGGVALPFAVDPLHSPRPSPVGCRRALVAPVMRSASSLLPDGQPCH
ncbi:hypothetical protein GWK47_038786 [Chionoecetes opilio]|uniref:Uncharacterized protein n=1 Tax=Chionoecetes opilio TaxID=41210 RepID=A0A8J4YDK0_CHIOP|nr:hypothetical protein GWK47_038786 [Chionoecetes opilio]